jgi:hypothetical protein
LKCDAAKEKISWTDLVKKKKRYIEPRRKGISQYNKKKKGQLDGSHLA